MQIPINCPCCNGPLQNTFITTSVHEEYLKKECFSKINHSFSCVVRTKDNMFCNANLSLNHKKDRWIVWNFDPQRLWLGVGLECSYTKDLPFFIPDFSNYRKLINKIKVYLTFS